MLSNVKTKEMEIIEVFYEYLPDQVISDVLNITEQELNRKTRRGLKNHKTNIEKIKSLNRNIETQYAFIENLFSYHFPDDNELLELAFEDIFEHIDENNFINCTIYLLKHYYFCSNNDLYKKTTIEFMQSDIFHSFLSGSNKGLKNDTYKEPTVSEIDMKVTNKYLCIVEEQNFFYNFLPQFLISDSVLCPVNSEQFPTRGSVHIYFKDSSKKNNFEKTDFAKYNRNLWIFEFNHISELENYRKNTSDELNIINKKIDGDFLINNNRITNINDQNIYEVVEHSSNDSNLNEVRIESEPLSSTIFLKTKDYIYGPYSHFEENNMNLLRPSNNYTLKKLSIEDCKLYKLQIPYSHSYISDTRTLEVIYFDYTNEETNEIDVIPDELLLKKFKSLVLKNYNTNNKLTLEALNSIINTYDFSVLSASRVIRLKEIIHTLTLSHDSAEELSEILSLFIKNTDSRLIDTIIEKMTEDVNLLKKLQKIGLSKSLFEKMQVDTEDKKVPEPENLIAPTDDKNSEPESLIAPTDDKNSEPESLIAPPVDDEAVETEKLIMIQEKIRDEIKAEEEALQQLKKKAKDRRAAETKLNEKIEELGKEEFYYSTRIKHLDKEIIEKQNAVKNIEQDLTDKLENVTRKTTDIAFDGMISNKMLQAASQWEKVNFEDEYKELVAKINKIPTNSFKDTTKAKEYIYTTIKKYRPNYTNNEITNFMICLSNSFLTVFAGDPGVGKTSICNIISKTFGLDLVGERFRGQYRYSGYTTDLDVNRYIAVSVEKGWTSKRDFIGYYNPLTKSFDKNNSALFSALNILDAESKSMYENFPFHILLDEANLSSMEHYWADFMNVCDFNSANRSVNIGEDYVYSIPKTLRFLATINYDHTTEALSPRLIDRSWIIMMTTNNNYSHTSSNIGCNEESIKRRLVSCHDLYAIFGNADTTIDPDISKALSDIYKLFNTQKISISPRIIAMIEKYLSVGQGLFECDEHTSGKFIALDYAVSQKLLPKIDGYGGDYEIFLRNLKSYCEKTRMMKCKNLLENILDKGVKNMQYYQFFS